MPYVSEAQRAYLHINEPEIAARWDKEYSGNKKLPKRAETLSDKMKKYHG